MKIVRYKVRALNRKGKVVFKKTFKVESKALKRVRKAMRNGRKVILRKRVKHVTKFEIRDDWGNTTTRTLAAIPVSIFVTHHSVTKHLSPNASVKQEKQEMRNVQSIGYARGLGGFPYGMGIFPSGRCYRGSGFGVVEAATGGYNTPTDSVCLIGNYDVFEPTKQQLDTLVTLGIWGRDHGYFTKPVSLDPHRKYKATACPGQHVVPSLPALQKRINGGKA